MSRKKETIFSEWSTGMPEMAVIRNEVKQKRFFSAIRFATIELLSPTSNNIEYPTSRIGILMYPVKSSITSTNLIVFHPNLAKT
jgi:hypothetical protein